MIDVNNVKFVGLHPGIEMLYQRILYFRPVQLQ